MAENSELFRNELILQLENQLSTEQLKRVLFAFDITCTNFSITRHPLDLIPVDGFPEVVKWYIAAKAIENCSQKTLIQYRNKLVNFFKTVQRPFTDIKANDIRIYLFNFQKTHNASDIYLDNIRVTLHSFYEWCINNDHMTRNPVKQVSKIKFKEVIRDPIPELDMARLRFATKDFRELALFEFLFSTGMRVSECADVQLTDIDWNKRSVHIRNGKGNKERIVYFSSNTKYALQLYLETREDATNALFVSTKAPFNPIGAHTIEEIISAIGKRIGLHIYPHRLRHTFASYSLQSGMPIEILQRLMGHANPKTTLIYAKLREDDVQIEHRRIYA